MVGPLPPKFSSPISPLSPIKGGDASDPVTGLTAGDFKACDTAVAGSIKQTVINRLAARPSGSAPLSSHFASKEATAATTPQKVGDQHIAAPDDELSEHELQGSIESSIEKLPTQRTRNMKVLQQILSKGTAKERRGLLKSFGSAISSAVDRSQEHAESDKSWRPSAEPLFEIPGQARSGSYPLPQKQDNELTMILMRMLKLPAGASGKYQSRLQELRSGKTPDFHSLITAVARDVEEDLKQYA
jgi:hypothetical protein